MALSGHIDESDKNCRNEKILYSNNRFTNKSSPLMGSDSSSSSEPITLSDTLSENNQLFSWAEMYGSLKQADSQSSVVPLLELGSRSSTINYLRELDGAKLIREPQMAFENWCAHKQRLHQQKLQIQRGELEKKRAEDENRKKLSKLCYEQWLKNKQRQASKNLKNLKNLSNQNKLQQVSNPSSKESCSNVVSESPTKIKINNKSSMSQAEIRQVVQSWWLKKKEQQQRQRQDKQRRLVKKKNEDQRRKKLVDQAWQTWISNVHTKPKPVPLNQGMQSLRGTISPLYINPEPWKRLNDTTESGLIKKMAR